ncbi:MAG: hypothetical protein ABR537_04805 [Gemmatimonadales bacterium]
MYAYNFFHNRNAAAAPSFWARYFSPSFIAQTIDTGSQASSEQNEMNGVGITRIVPLQAPGKARQETAGSTGNSYGAADGEGFCHSIDHVLAPGGIVGGYGVSLSTSNMVHCYLDIEIGTRITQAYWDGWANAVYNHVTSFGAGAPYYPAAYCNPASGVGISATGALVNVCQVLAYRAAGSSMACYRVWSNQPEQLSPCTTWCLLPGPTWGPRTCSGLGTSLWQFAEQNPCTDSCYSKNPTFPPVDLDKGYPSEDHRVYMLAC